MMKILRQLCLTRANLRLTTTAKIGLTEIYRPSQQRASVLKLSFRLPIGKTNRSIAAHRLTA
ncbi:MAG: hypothetical protein ACLUFM_02135 [Lachnospiraceae bacterium]